MNIQFENTYQFNRRSVVEYQYKIGGKRMLIYSAVCLLLALAYGIIGAVTERTTWYVVVAALGAAVYYAVYPYTFTKKTEKERIRRSGGVIPVTRVFFRDSIECTEGDTIDFEVEYTDINKVFVLKYGIFMTTYGKRGIMLDPDGFTVGEKEDFLPFLKEKCSSATWIYK